MCYDAEAAETALTYCIDAYEYYSMELGMNCGSLFEAWVVCLSMLTCEEFTSADPFCAAESDALAMACSGP